MGFQRRIQTKKPLEDNEIIELFWSRNESAIDETDIKYGKYLLAIAYNVLNDTLDSEECLNDTYLSVWNSIPPTRPNVLRAFLTTVMRRVAVNRYHSNSKKSAVPSEMTHSLSEMEYFLSLCDAESDFDTRQLGQIISEYLRSITSRRRYIFMSRYYVFKTVKQIAKDLGLSVSMINKELVIIKNGLKEKLGSEGYSV